MVPLSTSRLVEQLQASLFFRKEKRIFQQAMAEFGGLTKIVLRQLKASFYLVMFFAGWGFVFPHSGTTQSQKG